MNLTREPLDGAHSRVWSGCAVCLVLLTTACANGQEPGDRMDSSALIAALRAVPLDSICTEWKASCDSVAVEGTVKRARDPLYAFDRMPFDSHLPESGIKVGARAASVVRGLKRDTPGPPAEARVWVQRITKPELSDTVAEVFVELWMPGGPIKGAEGIVVVLHGSSGVWSPIRIAFLEG